MYVAIIIVVLLAAAGAAIGGDDFGPVLAILFGGIGFLGLTVLSVFAACLMLPVVLRAGLQQEFAAAFDFGWAMDFLEEDLGRNGPRSPVLDGHRARPGNPWTIRASALAYLRPVQSLRSPTRISPISSTCSISAAAANQSPSNPPRRWLHPHRPSPHPPAPFPRVLAHVPQLQRLAIPMKHHPPQPCKNRVL